MDEQVDVNLESNAKALEGWTKEEKFDLLTALKTYHSSQIKNLKLCIPTKTTEEVIAALNYYKRKAKNHRTMMQNKKLARITKIKPKSQVPLAAWASLLTDSFSFENLKTDTSTAVRLIADIENMPSPVYTEGIDFRKVYHQIANAMEGKGLVGNKLTNAVLKKCIVDTAFTSRSFIRNNTLKMVISFLNLNNQEPRTSYPSYSDNTELSLLRYLALQRAYNPLNIPENYLRPGRTSTETSN